RDFHVTGVQTCALPISPFEHCLYELRYDVRTHTVVQTAPRQDDFRVVTDRLRLVSEVIRVNSNAVAAYKAWAKWQEVPFCACRRSEERRVGKAGTCRWS